MKRTNLPALDLTPFARARPDARARFDVPETAIARWEPALKAESEKDDSTTISILDPIGYDPWTGDGVTAKRIAGALRAMRGKDVTVYVNSPGGDLFEGLAIYNLLRDHDGDVTVRIIGVAASAASIVAMAGDRVEIGRGAFLMIHNAWIVAMGNRHDLREAADWIEPFDMAMADIYAARTGLATDEIVAMLDAESWISAAKAIENKFADALLPADVAVKDDEKSTGRASAAAKRWDVAAARGGMTRTERRQTLAQIRGTRDAAHSGGTPRATEGRDGLESVSKEVANLIVTLVRVRLAAKQ